VYKPKVGDSIEKTALALVALAKETGRQRATEFNGVLLLAQPESSARDIVTRYRADIARSADAD
jgi:hypothetical protein